MSYHDGNTCCYHGNILATEVDVSCCAGAGMQFYVGGYLGGPTPDAKDGAKYPKYAGFCLETQVNTCLYIIFAANPAGVCLVCSAQTVSSTVHTCNPGFRHSCHKTADVPQSQQLSAGQKANSCYHYLGQLYERISVWCKNVLRSAEH